MKYSAVVALIGAASANMKTEKVFLKDEMESLLNIIKSVETNDATNVLDVIETRKEQLQLLMNSHPDRATHVLNELHNLLAVTKNVEENEMDNALTELEIRKDELTSKADDIMIMADGDGAAATDDATTDGAAATDDAAKDDAAKDATDPPATDADADTGSNTPLIIGIVGAALVLGVGGYCMCKKKGDDDGSSEGGVKEDKKMFKTVIKKNIKKVANTESLV